jgi:hypothetical protein
MRKSTAARLLLLAFGLVGQGVPAAQDPCDTLDNCVEYVRRHAKGQRQYAHSMQREDEELVARLLKFDGVVARVMPMLRDPDEGVANFAGIVLRDARSIDAKYLSEIKAGLDRGLGWLSPALCAMPGDEPAREAVKRFLVSSDAPTNQESFAVEKCGMRAMPFILAAAKCSTPCPPGAHRNLAYVLTEMSPDIGPAIGPGLVNATRDPRTSEQTARGLLSMIAVLGESAAGLQGGLRELRNRRPALAADVDAALVGIHADSAGKILAHGLASSRPGFETTSILRNIADLRAGGRDAGPEVLRLAGSSDWDTRVAAVRALGFIDYLPGVPAIVAALGDAADPRLNWVAAESLGRLKVASALDQLRSAGSQHWYPPVRRAANAAVEQSAEVRPIRPTTSSLMSSSGKTSGLATFWPCGWLPMCRAASCARLPRMGSSPVIRAHSNATAERRARARPWRFRKSHFAYRMDG